MHVPPRQTRLRPQPEPHTSATQRPSTHVALVPQVPSHGSSSHAPSMQTLPTSQTTSHVATQAPSRQNSPAPQLVVAHASSTQAGVPVSSMRQICPLGQPRP
jgi:hypothetical protein